MVVLRNAEAACLAAIQAENPRIARFSASTNSREQRRLQLSQRIRHPQFTERLRCAYQPQWDFKSGEVAGLEALARWWDPELGEISPSEFISIAEEHETIAERLGERILSIACQQRLEWRQYLPDDIRVAVNISATQLRSGSLKKTVLDCLMRTGLPPSMLELEITESEALADLARADALLQSLRREGITIAIDDFGVGYSSLSYLGSLPATSLKVDRAFIVGINENRRRADLLRGVCDLGHALNMIVVIEGVESFGAAAWLRTIGFDRVQGFAIARPLAAQALLDWYENDRGRIARMLDEAGGSL
jgi:EAL domain-containing protein (putative c-di-GMP-specific phosphodiesterase class I)